MQIKAFELEKEFPTVPHADFAFLLCNLKHCTPGQLAIEQTLSPDEADALKRWLARVQSGEPPQYVVQKAWFYALELYVDPRVLIPRFDTEVLVEALIPHLVDNAKVLEIGVGSGAISLALKQSRPDLQIIATDIDAKALEVARINSNNLNLPIKLLNADLFPENEHRFDAVVSNPPYISPEEYSDLEESVRDHEPKIALLAADNGLEFYKRILDKVSQYLSPGGILAFEHGSRQQADLLHLTESAGFKILQKGRDLADRDRFLIAKLK
ncbi:MAG: peptide chain release factor N(5)-glutamine methyltransferase [Candidatus Cloacimonetes bacterium]|jgi:release factor glutamine methyltransferase|nr:peptide chain release factor N(5)-glutamine methyltransferase [Candidatus Cloacimonadota bacterium]MDD2507222.1 peptide chain release factor N(5)-glutamine methyltransferase [Candidatus Cloacimonadota bacterium]MDD4147135.1 peptide chain release factor N(5)-glutamine methyltransferase [Candidatus Cloacimonadota bacterium]MDD4560322.1 peptide chain release factor N(5)-glutamine methyltransferase [Candidatus Cloacimonadota bacterium]